MTRGRLDPAVADVRRAVREALRDIEAGRTVLVACSGGPDSMALAAAARFESRAGGWSVAAVVVDHGLQPVSAQVSADVAARLEGLGITDVTVVPVHVEERGGPEAAARSARYAALAEVAAARDAGCVLLGHTRDDQAETVLLGLARGSGARSLAGMAPTSGRYRRPLLDLPRTVTEQACRAEGIAVWRDPHNEEPAFARVRVRRRVLPALEAELGPGVAEALARSGRLLRDDADALDAYAASAYARCRVAHADRLDGDADAPAGSGRDAPAGWPDGGPGDAPAGSGRGAPAGHPDGDPGDTPAERALDVDALLALLPALRRRVLRRAALDAGCPPTDLTAGHVAAMDALVTRWHGQQGVDLPGCVQAIRRRGTLRLRRRVVGG